MRLLARTTGKVIGHDDGNDEADDQ
jgi:hypothetical protein